MNLSPLPIQKFFGNDGRPLVGGLLFTYLSGTSTKTATYTDAGGFTQNTNPIVLDYRGECRLWIDPQQSYTFVLAPATDTDPPTNPIWTVNAITAGPAQQDNYATDTGSVNAIALAIPQISSPVAFTRIVFKVAVTNTGPVTITINGGTAKALKYQNTAAFAGGEILAAGIYEAVFDGTQWQLQGPAVAIWRTAAEIAASVMPTNYVYAPGQRARYASLADAAAVSATHPMILIANESISTSISLPAGASIKGYGMPAITNITAGSHVFDATSVAGVTIDGVRFVGANSTTVPSSGFGGYSAANNGLVTITTCTDVRVTNCEFDTFYNGLTIQNCTLVWALWNKVRNFRLIGIIGSLCKQYWIDYNDIQDCTQTGAAVCYGITATGDEAGGNIQRDGSISFNTIVNVKSWDAIMSHDCDGLRVIGNKIREVRRGVDIGHLVSTNVVKNLTITDNEIELTTTDNWAAASADTGGIQVLGYDATHRVAGAMIANNKVRKYGGATGMTAGGTPGPVVIAHADDVTIANNQLLEIGNVITSPGIYVNGTVNRLVINGNLLQGAMATGAIRLATVTGADVAINGNVIKQTTASDNAILISSSTITDYGQSGNVSNSTSPFSNSGSTVTYLGDVVEGSATYDPPNLADGAGTTTTVTVTGAAVGDYAVASFGGDISGITMTAYVSAANTVSVRLQNETTGPIDLGSSTLRARVFKRLA